MHDEEFRRYENWLAISEKDRYLSRASVLLVALKAELEDFMHDNIGPDWDDRYKFIDEWFALTRGQPEFGAYILELDEIITNRYMVHEFLSEDFPDYFFDWGGKEDIYDAIASLSTEYQACKQRMTGVPFDGEMASLLYEFSKVIIDFVSLVKGFDIFEHDYVSHKEHGGGCFWDWMQHACLGRREANLGW